MAEQSEKSTVNCQQPQLSQKAEKRSSILLRPSGPHQCSADAEMKVKL